MASAKSIPTWGIAPLLLLAVSMYMACLLPAEIVNLYLFARWSAGGRSSSILCLSHLVFPPLVKLPSGPHLVKLPLA